MGCDLILEFGGGYGSMCRLAHNLGFRGDYIIYDFPEFCALQTFFLKSIGLPVCKSGSSKGIRCLSDIDVLQQLLGEHGPGFTNSLFLATWSISETSLELRDSIFNLVKQFGLYLIACQNSFGEVDNKDYFGKWRREYSLNMNWFDQPMSHHKGNNYLFGNLKNEE